MTDQGNLYYVRLKTELGLLYKIGFTTLNSVEQRLGYSGSDDRLLIDKVLMFMPFGDALLVEAKLHSMLEDKKAFGDYSHKSDFPLAGNGQSELYAEDVLGMDSHYTDEQGASTSRNIKNKLIAVYGEPEEPSAISDFLFIVVNGLINLIVFIYALLFVDAEEAERKAEAATKAKIIEKNKGLLFICLIKGEVGLRESLRLSIDIGVLNRDSVKANKARVDLADRATYKLLSNNTNL